MVSKLKQPKGMYILAFTEIFERFSYYTLAFLLVLFASASPTAGGLGWSNEKALELVGLYTLGAYTLPILGSYLADEYIGKGKAVIFGGITIIVGHFFMLFSKNESMFYLALFCIAFGTGFFKPCMPSLLGDLYKANDTRRESGFSWYYLGINIGAMIAGISGGILSKEFGYQVALASAGIGMLFGMIIFVLGRKHLVLEFTKKAKRLKDTPKKSMTKIQKRALGCLVLAFGFFAIWTTVYNIAVSGTLSLYIEKFTNRTVFAFEVPTTFFMSLESLTIIVVTPIMTYILAKLALKKKYPHFFTQMNFAVFIAVIAIGYFTYLSYLAKDLGGEVKPFEYYQIMLFIVLLSISELIISPVMMSTISVMAPLRYKSLFQAFYLATFGVTGLIAAKIGGISLKSPFETFLVVSIVILVSAVLYLIVRPKMIKISNEAAK